MKTILFVCSGNTCRSPMAEAIARHWLDEQGENAVDETFIASAGVYASDGSPPTPEAVEALSRVGVEHEGASKRLTPEMVDKADLVLCMTQGHVDAVREMIRDLDSDTVIERIDPQADVEDPIGMGQTVYDAVVRELKILIPERLSATGLVRVS